MSVVEVLLGGVLASMGGAGVMWLERRGLRQDKKLHLDDARSARVLGMVLKIQQMHAWNCVIRRVIDECFESAGDPQGEIEPGLKVLPIIIPAFEPEPFTPEDLALAFETKDTGLVEKLMAVATNFQANLQTLREFNALRKEFMNFTQENAQNGFFQEGDKARVSLSATLKHGFQSRVVMLNQLVGHLMEATEKDASECELTLKRLCSALSSIDGIRVPLVTLNQGGN